MTFQEFQSRYKYDVDKDLIGAGAFGTVFKVYDDLLDQWKALKIAQVKIIGDKEFSLLKEFEAVQDLATHKNIAHYENVLRYKMPNGNYDYALMQYYPQGTLKELVKEKISAVQKEALAEGLLNGVKFLHKKRVLHRDLKPSNILVSEYAGIYTPKITDFGLSKLVYNAGQDQITNSFAGGTLEYSAPEQLLGKELKFNADLWSLGVILFEIFMGVSPFNIDSEVTNSEAKRRLIYQNILNKQIPNIDNNCPAKYQKIVKACLVKDPEIRVKSIDDILIETGVSKPKAQPSIISKKYSDETVIINVDAQEHLKSDSETLVQTPYWSKNPFRLQLVELRAWLGTVFIDSYFKKISKVLLGALLISMVACPLLNRKTGFEKIVYDWNQAHLSKDQLYFENNYADYLMYYREHQWLKEEAIKDKFKAMDVKNYKQSIVSPIEIDTTQDSIAVLKFDKMVKSKNANRIYPSYMILKKSGERWLIEVESDFVTDSIRAAKDGWYAPLERYFNPRKIPAKQEETKIIRFGYN